VGIYYLINDAANTTGIPPFALILIVIGAVVILVRRWLAADTALDYPSVSSHIVARQAPTDKGMIPTMSNFSPRETVSELDRFIIGQNEAKRAVAIAEKPLAPSAA
jgi:hypothetical protein